MKKYEYLKIEDTSHAAALVTLNRPNKRNALSLPMMEELTYVFEEHLQPSEYRSVILKAEGSTFCSGLDLQEALDASFAEKVALIIARMLTAIYTTPLVTIAAVQGDAIGGGAGLVVACDFAIMAKAGRIGFPETRLGLIAAQVATLLCRQIRMRDVRELLLLGKLIHSQHALTMGVVNRVVEEKNLFPEALRVAEEVLKGAPKATQETKRLLHTLDPTRFSEDLKKAISFHQAAKKSAEAKEGIKAFLEKRAPRWDQVDEEPQKIEY